MSNFNLLMLFEANIENITSKKANFLKKNKPALKKNKNTPTRHRF